jgi:hypothetical protein
MRRYVFESHPRTFVAERNSFTAKKIQTMWGSGTSQKKWRRTSVGGERGAEHVSVVAEIGEGSTEHVARLMQFNEGRTAEDLADVTISSCRVREVAQNIPNPNSRRKL